jgi:hypothetical protein
MRYPSLIMGYHHRPTAYMRTIYHSLTAVPLEGDALVTFTVFLLGCRCLIVVYELSSPTTIITLPLLSSILARFVANRVALQLVNFVNSVERF